MSTYWEDKDNEDIEDDNKEDDGHVAVEPKTSAGPSYPEDDQLEKAKPDNVRLGENPPPVIKKTVLWEDAFWDSDEPLTKREFAEKFQMFWEEKQKESKKSQLMWDENPAKKSENLVTKAQGELQDLFKNKLKTGQEVQLDYKTELARMYEQPEAYSQQAKQTIVDKAFSEITACFQHGNILSKEQGRELLGQNLKANKTQFFRSKRRK